MKRYLTLLFLVTVMASLSYAQTRSGGFRRLQLDDNTGSPVYLTNASGSVGINTANAAPSTCALLDLSSTTKGLLIPRMAGGQVAALCQTPGMLAYNITTNTFDYWNGAMWTTLSSNANWMLSGNTLTGTPPNLPNEWFGSANNFDVVFKANSAEAMRIASGGQVGIGTAPTGRLVAIADATNIGNYSGAYANFAVPNSLLALSANKEVTSAGAFNGPYAVAAETNVTASTVGEIGTLLGWGRTSGTSNSGLVYSVLGRNDNSSSSTIGTMATIESYLGSNSGPITSYSGYFMQQLNNSGTITNCYGLNISGFSNSGTMTNTYGVYVGDITSGTQTNQAYSFYASDVNARSFFNGKNGFGTNAGGDASAPQTAVDVAGALSIRYDNSITAFGAGASTFNPDIFAESGFTRIQAGAGTSFKGILGGKNGRILILHKVAGNALTLNNEDGTEATPANRIHCMSGANVVIPAGEAIITLIYEGGSGANRWFIKSISTN